MGDPKRRQVPPPRDTPPGRKGGLTRPGAHPASQWLGLVALTAAAVLALRLAGAPAALLLGPMAVGIFFGVRGATIRPSPVVFTAAQALVGCMVAAHATPALFSGVVAHAPVFVLLACSTLAITAALGWMMTVAGWLPGATAIWGFAPGAATAMVLMSESFGGDRRLVAMIQYLRILMVAGAAIGLAHLQGGGEGQVAAAGRSTLEPASVLLTLALAVVGGAVGKLSRIPAGVFLAPMLAGAVLQATGLARFSLPTAVLAGAYAVVGWTIGLSFTRSALAYSARLLPRIILALFAMLLACGALAAITSGFTGVDLLSAWLATSPGGVDSILIIAASTPVDLPFILGAQLVRFLLVLALGPVLARWVARRTGHGPRLAGAADVPHAKDIDPHDPQARLRR